MSVITSEMTLKKALINSDGDTNGGVLGLLPISSGVRHGIFPRVTRAERVSGKTRYRKVFLKNGNATETAYGALAYLTFPSPAGDRFYIAQGTQTDTEEDIVATPPDWCGCGQLNTAVSAGSTSIEIAMESNDFVFPQNGWLHVSSNYKTGQTIASGVTPGASVTYADGVWSMGSHAGDTVFPNGIFMSSGVVQTDDGTGAEEWLKIADVATPYSYSGNVATVTLADPLVASYTTTNTWAAACAGEFDIVATVDTFVKSSSGGTYDSASAPISPNNIGCIEDEITITFTGSGTYSASGANAGVLGSSSVSAAFSPVNTNTSTAYFTIPIGFFSGSWIADDTLTFSTHPAAMPLWLKEVVPAGTSANANNMFGLGYYWE